MNFTMHFSARFLTLLLTAQLLGFCSSIVAAESDSENGEERVQLSTTQLQELITTLESDSARERFLTNLRTLSQAKNSRDDGAFSLSQTFDIDTASSNLLQRYYSFIEKFGVTDNTIGKGVIMAILALIILVMCLFNNRLSAIFNRQLGSMRTQMGLSKRRFKLVFNGQRIFGYAIGSILIINAAFYIFGNYNIFTTQSWVYDLSSFIIVIMLIWLFVVLVWETVNAAMEYGMNENSSLNSSRVKTLLPVVRNLAFFFIALLSCLVVLSELGIDIVPLLAGAGVLGIAIGFGAQTMVKDFLTGFIIILEDLLQVGDVVSVGGRTGAVERITLRKIQIRNLDGTVHTVPHSEVSVVDNLTKEFSYYLMKVGVAYKEDTDQVVELIQQIDTELRNDSYFGSKILEPIQVLGVDEFADSAVIIKVRSKTKPHDKWKVGREFNRRLKKLFDENGIEIPFPHRTLFFANDGNKKTEKLAGQS